MKKIIIVILLANCAASLYPAASSIQISRPMLDDELLFPFIQQNDEEKVSQLIQVIGVQVDARDANGCTGLMVAIAYKLFDMARLLLDYGAYINARDNEGRTPFMRAIYNHDIDAVRFLIDAGANINIPDLKKRTPLMVAVGRFDSSRDLPIIKLLIDKGAFIDVEDYKGRTVLEWAPGNKQLIDYILFLDKQRNKENKRKKKSQKVDPDRLEEVD